MVFRLPTPLEGVSAPSGHNQRRSRPWRGTFILQSGNFGAYGLTENNSRIAVAAAETEGDNRVSMWPKAFSLHLVRASLAPAEIQQWATTQSGLPLCMFMPDRHARQVATGASGPSMLNEGSFRALASLLRDQQMICFAPWPQSSPTYNQSPPGAGILILPSSSSSALLIGVIFLTQQFPEDIFPTMSSSSAGPGTGAPGFMPSGLVVPSVQGSVPYVSGSSYDMGGYDQAQAPPSGQYQGYALNDRQNSSRALDDPVYLANGGPYSTYGCVHQGNAYMHDIAHNKHLRTYNEQTLRSALEAGPFDWAAMDVFDTENSGNTSPGSTRTW